MQTLLNLVHFVNMLCTWLLIGLLELIQMAKFISFIITHWHIKYIHISTRFWAHQYKLHNDNQHKFFLYSEICCKLSFLSSFLKINRMWIMFCGLLYNNFMTQFILSTYVWILNMLNDILNLIKSGLKSWKIEKNSTKEISH